MLFYFFCQLRIKNMIFDTRHLVIEMSYNLKMFASKIGYGLIYAKCKQP